EVRLERVVDDRVVLGILDELVEVGAVAGADGEARRAALQVALAVARDAAEVPADPGDERRLEVVRDVGRPPAGAARRVGRIGAHALLARARAGAVEQADRPLEALRRSLVAVVQRDADVPAG